MLNGKFQNWTAESVEIDATGIPKDGNLTSCIKQHLHTNLKYPSKHCKLYANGWKTKIKQHFLISHIVFRSFLSQDYLNFEFYGKESKYKINPFPNKPWFLRVCSKSLLSNSSRNKQFLLCLLCFLPVWRTFCHLYQT